MKGKYIWMVVATTAAMLTLFSACKDNSTSSYGYTPPPSPSPRPTANTVSIANMAFGPSSLTVLKSTTVTWKNNDGVAHTATGDNGMWNAGTIQSGSSASVTFNTSGTFTYHCSIHPSMTGTIIVQ